MSYASRRPRSNSDLISAQADCNEDDGFDETLVPCDYTSCGQIPDDALWKKLVNMAPNRADIKSARWRWRRHDHWLISTQVPEGVRLTAIMDCCHSGTGLDLPFKFQQGRGWEVDDDPGFSAGDVQMFSGCRTDPRANVLRPARRPHGRYSQATTKPRPTSSRAASRAAR